MSLVFAYPGNADVLAPDQTFDVTTTVLQQQGTLFSYFSTGTDGTTFAIHVAPAYPAGGGPIVPRIVGWSHDDGAIHVQGAACNMSPQPLYDALASPNPSSADLFAYLTGDGDVLTGSESADLMKGLGGNDTFKGDPGDDRFLGGDGEDLIQGGIGDDRLKGNHGHDTLSGDAGSDVLTGGAGRDVFVFRAVGDGIDRITDFAVGKDHVGLGAVALGLGPLVEGANLIFGTAATSTGATVLYDAASGALSLDADGTDAGAAVVMATLTGAPVLSLSDFWLI